MPLLLRTGDRPIFERFDGATLRARLSDDRALALGVRGVLVMERPADVSCVARLELDGLGRDELLLERGVYRLDELGRELREELAREGVELGRVVARLLLALLVDGRLGAVACGAGR